MPEPTSFDEKTAEYLTRWGQHVSRRGLLSRAWQFALSLAGLSLVPVLPVDRAFAQGITGCSDWRMCGIHGFFCKACCGGGASYTTCPSCTSMGGAWTGCCKHVIDECTSECKQISYADCCGGDATAAACTGEECPPGGGEGTPAYCGLSAFRCTVVREMVPCTGC